MKILYTGGDGQLAVELKKYNENLDIYFASKNECNLIRREVLNEFAQEHKYFDVVITGANIYPGGIEGYNLASFLVPINHIYLLEKFTELPKYFINLTTGMKNFDEHYLYRSQKLFGEDIYTRFFKYKEAETQFINLMPHHLDDDEIRTTSAKLFLSLLENIENYKEVNYVLDVKHDRIKAARW